MTNISSITSSEQRDRSTPFTKQCSSHYLGSFVCSILGDKAYLYLKEEQLEAHIYNRKGEFHILSPSQIQGGRRGNMPLEQLVQLVKTVAAPFLFASYQNKTLRIFIRDFQEIETNRFLKPRIKLPPSFFECVKRENLLKTLQNELQKTCILVLVKEPKLPFKRVGKTELAHQYFKEYGKDYKHAFWIKAFDSWHLQEDLEEMGSMLGLKWEAIPHWLESTSSYLLVFDGVEDPQLILSYLPNHLQNSHILITSRSPCWSIDLFKIGLLSLSEGSAFLMQHTQGAEESAKEVTRALGYVPSSLYRAVETITVEEVALSRYLTYIQTLLDKNGEIAAKISNLPPRNKDFIGREADLVALEESFSSNKPIVIAANAGLGGIGKTQIAIQYAYRSCPNYNLIWWINAFKLDIAYDALAQRLGIYLLEEEEKENHAIVKKVNSHLEKNPGWLLIFDNVEAQENVQGLLPSSGGHVLITTRSTKWDNTQVEVFDVGVFTREESVELLLKVTGLYGQEQEANKLAGKLQDLPLALAQAAAYIKQTQISIAEYTEDFKKRHQALWKREEITKDYEFTVNVTWNISMDKIQEEEKREGIVPQPIALLVMQFCSFLAPNNIPKDILIERWLEEFYEENQRDIKACLSDLNRTLALLEAFSMIKVSEGEISIHALVQTVTRDNLASQRQLKCLGVVLNNLFLAKSDPEDPKNIITNRKIAPHCEFIMKRSKASHLKEVRKNEHFPMILEYLSEFYDYLGNFHKKYKYAEQKVKVAEEFYSNPANPKSPSNHNLASSYDNLANALDSLGQYEEALKYHWKSFKIKEEIYGKNSVRLALPLNNLGINSWHRGKHQEAIDYLEASLRLYERIYSRKNIKVAKCVNNIGIVLGEMGKYKEALDRKTESLQAFKEIFGEEHPYVAASLNNIASTLTHLGEYEKALEYHRNALHIREKALPPDHPDLADSFNNIGMNLQNLGLYQEALEYKKKALELRQRIFDQNNPYVAKSLESVGSALAKLGRNAEALRYKTQAVDIRKKSLGQDHPDTIASMLSLANTLDDLEKYEESLSLKKQVLKFRKNLQNKNQYDIAECYNGIGYTLSDCKKYEEALKYFNKSFKIYEQLGECHPSAITNLYNIGGMLGELNQSHEAIKKIQKALELSCKVFPKNHPSYELYLNNLLIFLEKEKDPVFVQNVKNQILPLALEKLGEEHPSVQHLKLISPKEIEQNTTLSLIK